MNRNTSLKILPDGKIEVTRVFVETIDAEEFMRAIVEMKMTHESRASKIDEHMTKLKARVIEELEDLAKEINTMETIIDQVAEIRNKEIEKQRGELNGLQNKEETKEVK